MRILHVNYSDLQGGAARAAYRLHRALLDKGIESKMLVQIKFSDDYTVLGPETQKQKLIAFLRSGLEKLPLRKYKNRSKTYFSPAWVPFSYLANRINALNPDIVHLHWVNNGMHQIEDLYKIKAPIVWSLHDMWAFTGGCHNDEQCGRFKTICDNCPVLGSKSKRDLSANVFSRKFRAYPKINSLTIVGLSSWMYMSAKESTLLTDRRIENLPNPINTEVFKPFNKQMARELLGLPINKQLILFGAIGGSSDPNKGYPELSQALIQLNTTNIDLLVFGCSKPNNSDNFNQRTHHLGHIHDDVTLRLLYNSADVTVVPSLQENLSNVIMESLACGTPVVGFDIGGNGDMINHKKNGYLAQPYEIGDLANGIKWILDNQEKEILKNKALETIHKNFDSSIVCNKYIQLYNSIIKR